MCPRPRAPSKCWNVTAWVAIKNGNMISRYIYNGAHKGHELYMYNQQEFDWLFVSCNLVIITLCIKHLPSHTPVRACFSIALPQFLEPAARLFLSPPIQSSLNLIRTQRMKSEWLIDILIVFWCTMYLILNQFSCLDHSLSWIFCV